MEAAESHTPDNPIQNKLVDARRHECSLPPDTEVSVVSSPGSVPPDDLLLSVVDDAGSGVFEEERTANRGTMTETMPIKPSSGGTLQHKYCWDDLLVNEGAAGPKVEQKCLEREIDDFLKTDRSSRAASGTTLADESAEHYDPYDVAHSWNHEDSVPLEGIANGGGCRNDGLNHIHKAPSVVDEHPTKRMSDGKVPSCVRLFLASDSGSSHSDTGVERFAESDVERTKGRCKTAYNSIPYGKSMTDEGHKAPVVKSLRSSASSCVRSDERVPPVGGEERSPPFGRPDMQLVGRRAEDNMVEDEGWEGWLNDDEDSDEASREFPTREMANASPINRNQSATLKQLPVSPDISRRRSSFRSLYRGKGSLISMTRMTRPASAQSPSPVFSGLSRKASKRAPVKTWRPHALPSWRENDGAVGDIGEAEEDDTVREVRDSQPPMCNNNHPHFPWANQICRKGNARRSSDDWFAPDTALDTGNGFGRFDSSGSSCMSGISSTIDSQDSPQSRIEIHDFFDESTESGAYGKYSGHRGDSEGAGRGGNVGSGVGDEDLGGAAVSKEIRNAQGVRNGTLNTEDIAFLAERSELRDTMLAVGDLHLGELPLARQVALLRDLRTVHFRTDDTIFHEGDAADAVYFILGPSDATVTVVQHDEQLGKETRTSEVGCGPIAERLLAFVPAARYFGEQGLVHR